jgi:cyclopropane fatty-acyl-phospholipid synthase-like methyltransferase
MGDPMIDQLLLWRDHFIPGPALDIGDGEISLWLAMHGFAVDALEPNQQQAEILHSRFAAYPIQLHLLDVLDFPLPSEKYALIIASAVLHFINREQLQPLAQRLIKSLISGGMLFAAAITTDDPAYQKAQAPDATHVHHFFGRGELRRLFLPLDVVVYEESRRSAPESMYGYRSGATLIARQLPASQAT